MYMRVLPARRGWVNGQRRPPSRTARWRSRGGPPPAAPSFNASVAVVPADPWRARGRALVVLPGVRRPGGAGPVRVVTAVEGAVLARAVLREQVAERVELGTQAVEAV